MITWSLRTRRSGGPLLVVWGTVSCWREIGCASPWFVFPPASAIKKLELYKISFFLFELMPDFKSFEHKLWVFWQNVKNQKNAKKYILFGRNVLYIEKYLSTNGDISFSRVKAKSMPRIIHFAKVVLSHISWHSFTSTKETFVNKR